MLGGRGARGWVVAGPRAGVGRWRSLEDLRKRHISNVHEEQRQKAREAKTLRD